MKKYRVYGLYVTPCEAWTVSVYDELISADSPEKAVIQAIQWNIEESCTGKFDADRGMILYYNALGKIEHIIAQIEAVEVSD